MTTNAVNDKKDNTTEDFASSSFFSDDASSWESSLEEGDHDVKGKDDGGECENFVKEENRAVSLVRKLAIAILLLGAAALSTSTYFLLRAREIKEFDNAFHDYATRVISTFEERMQRQTDMARFLASTAATLAERSGSTWPFVDAPDVDDVSLSLSGARSILFSPFVSRDQVTEWEEFSGKTITDKKEISLDENITTYMPFYQVAPTSQTPFSAQTFDLLQVPSFGSGLKEMFQTGDPLVTDFESNGNTTDVSGEKVDVGTARPVGLLFYPIFNGTKVAGAYVLVFHWHHFLQGILSPDENGLLGVLETCNASFSFQLDDGSAKYLGGDYSDAIFDQIGSKVMFANKECNYQLTVSPTKDMEESFTTNFPVIATSMVVLIFIVLLLIFFSYDTALWRRQKAVMIRAKQSNAIVTSLFPAAVRDRLMEEAEKGTLKPRGPTSSLEPTESLSLSQLNSSEADHQSTRSLALKPRDDVSRSQHTASRVIADLYPKCSVCFADLVGFTAWSSQRSPEMVFMLLEGIFARWDKIATRLEVFKVETIGDCYLSVTGKSIVIAFIVLVHSLYLLTYPF